MTPPDDAVLKEKWPKQLFKHDPENGVYGDCFRTAIACLFGLRPEEVPPFYGSSQGQEQRETANEWLKERGWRLVAIPFQHDGDHQPILDMFSSAVDLHYLLSGTSRTGVNHNVICKAGEIIHDPSLTDSGIIGPCDDGYYWVEFLVPYDGTARQIDALRAAGVIPKGGE